MYNKINLNVNLCLTNSLEKTHTIALTHFGLYLALQQSIFPFLAAS